MKIKPSILALGFFLAAILLYTAIFNPMSDALIRANSELTIAHDRLKQTHHDITSRDDLLKQIENLKKLNQTNRENLIQPMLNSYAMRAKSFLDVPAHEAGLTNLEYDESGFRALPLPMGIIPKNRTARRMVKIKALGDYAAIVSFMLRIEKDLPLMTIQSLKIDQPAQAAADIQKAELIVEWPCEGEVIK